MKIITRLAARCNARETESMEIAELEQHNIYANGINIHYVAKGSGPVVLMCHGFPESWYSWRHQIDALSDAGYRAVAMSMRGYGGTDAPADVNAYGIIDLIGDVVAVANDVSSNSLLVVGHDWGAPVAWYSALVRPDLFKAVACLSVPWIPPVGGLPEGIDLNFLMRQAAGPEQDYYRLYFQEPRIAEADLEADIYRTMLGFLYTISGEAVASGDLTKGWDGYFPLGETFTKQLIIPQTFPNWLTEDDLQFYVKEITRTGFRGGVNWYRNLNKLPAALGPWVGKTIEQPSFYMCGSTDLIAGNTSSNISVMKDSLADLRYIEILEGAGHWLQQERPEEVNKALLNFINTLN